MSFFTLKNGEQLYYEDTGSLFSPALAEWYRDHVKAPFDTVCFPDSDHMLVSNDPKLFAESVEKLL